MTGLTSAERALELFQTHPPGENRIDWLANQLLALAAEGRSLTLRIVHSGAEKRVMECSDSAHTVTSDHPGTLRVFRTLLARFAKMAEEENAAAFTPYGGNVHFDRPSSDGPARLYVEFQNTTQAQSLGITKSTS